MEVKKDQPLQTANKVQVVKLRDEAVFAITCLSGYQVAMSGEPFA